MFNRVNKKFEITAPPSTIAGQLQHPPPALLVRPSNHEHHGHAKDPRNPSFMDEPQHSKKRSDQPRSQTPNHYKGEKKKKKKFLSVFRKKSGGVDEADGGRQSEPLTRRPHSATSDNRLVRYGSSRSAKSTEYLTDDDDDFNYPRFRGSIQPVTSGVPAYVPRLPNNQRANSEPATYDALENYRPSTTKESVSRAHSYSEQYSGPLRPNLKLTPQHTPPGSVTSSDSRSTAPKLDDHTASSPGVVGIKNHGNTCFVNAIIQCLSNTEPLLLYFLSDKYRQDLKRRSKSDGILPGGNSAHSKVSDKPAANALDPEGSNIVTEHLGFLLKTLWNGQYETRVSAVFKEIVGVKSEQYRGRNQHDAQEFLMWLLDQLHEDLNQATGCLPISRTKNVGAMRREEDIAADTLSEYLQCHDSAVYNVFSAQYHSSVCCPQCSVTSNTFDPYLCVSVSVPRRGNRPVYITMARRHQNTTKVLLFGLNLKVHATIHDIQRQLAIEARTLPHYLVIGDMKHDGFHQFFRPTDTLAVVSEQSVLYAYEVTPYKGDFAVPLPPSLPGLPHAPYQVGERGSETIFIILQNRVGQGEYSKRFGNPLCLRVWRDFTYSQLQSVVFKSMRRHLHEGVNPEVVCRDYIFFKCYILDGLPGEEYLDPYSPSPLMSPSVEKALANSKVWGYEPHIKITAEWDQWVKDCVCSDIPDVEPPVHSSAHIVRDHFSIPLEAHLDDCLQWHTKEEKLDDDDLWVCPRCSKPQTGAIKKISFWTLPDVLVFHLKRFEQDEYTQSKLDTWVKFPVTGLDMTPYLTKSQLSRPSSATGFRDKVVTPFQRVNSVKSPTEIKEPCSEGSRTLPLKSVQFQDLKKSTHNSSSKKLFIFKKSKKSKKSSSSNEPTSPSQETILNRNDNLYDLYAVCNHHGNMTRGHYIAQCLNPVNKTWHTFDDHHVVSIHNTEHIVTQNAYILFYVRRAYSSSLHQSSGHAHWIHQIPKRTLDLSQLPPLDHHLFTAQRQNSVTSAHTLSTASGVSPDNTAAHNTKPLVPGSYTAAGNSGSYSGNPSSYKLPDMRHPNTYHDNPLHRVPGQQLPQLHIPGRGSTSSYSGPTSPTTTYPNLPSPTSPPTYLSQQAPPTTNYFPQRGNSFHGNTRYGTGEAHSATRV